MPRKVYDIKPPKQAQKTEKQLKEIASDSGKRKQRGRRKEEKPFNWIPLALVGIVIVMAGGVYLFFKLQKVEVLIWPKVETLTFEQTIIADKTANYIDVVQAIIPAQYFEATKTNSQDFPATGNASNEGYSSGTITIYNKYDPPTPIAFRAGTHFLSDSGKLFIASQRISIPAAKKSGTKITPGSIQVNVKAVEAGSDYNIPPSNFSVPGLKGTSYYYGIYATSEQAMEGGYTGKVKKVTEDDIEEAEEVLTQKTTADALSDLKRQISADYILLEDTVLSGVAESEASAKAGSISENFNYKVTATASTLAFKKSDLDEFARKYISSKIPEGKTFLDSSLAIEYSASVSDVSGGKITLNLDISFGVYKNVNKNSMALSMIGENADQIRETIDNAIEDDVSKVQVKFWPFWVVRAPNNQGAIDIILKFE